MGLYRLFYIANWIYRANTERGYRHHPLVYTCGCIQTFVYLNYFRQYCRAMAQKEHDEGETDDDEGGLIFEHQMVTRRKIAGAAIGPASTAPLITPPNVREEAGEV